MTPQDTSSNLLGYAQEQYWGSTPTATSTPTTTTTTTGGEVRTPDASGWLGVPYALPGGTTTQAPAAVVDTQAAQRSSLQKNIQKLVGDAMGVYDALYGNLSTAAASQRQALESRFGRETGALGEQFTQEIPRIGQAYAARGAYDSSWRGGAESRAKKAFEGQLATLGEEQKAAMGKIGQEVATQEAQFGAGQAELNRALALVPQTTDITELTNLQTEIQKQINNLRTQQAGLQSQEAFVQRFQQLAPASDRMAQLSRTLSTIIQGEAPVPLKQSVAAQIIAGSGLTEEEKQQALTNFNAQLTAPATTVA